MALRPRKERAPAGLAERSGSSLHQAIFGLRMGNGLAGIRLCEAAVNFGQKHEMLDGILECHVIGEILHRLQDLSLYAADRQLVYS